MKLAFMSIAGLMLLASASQPLYANEPETTCQSAAHRQFDFFLGDWDAYSLDEPLKIVARNRVTLTLNDCVVYEDYRQNDGLHGKSFSIYDAGRGVWHQSWVTNRGDLLLLDGHFGKGKLAFQGHHRTPAGKDEIVRVAWFPQDRDVRETAVRSLDGGKTWLPMFDILFKPHH